MLKATPDSSLSPKTLSNTTLIPKIYYFKNRINTSLNLPDNKGAQKIAKCPSTSQQTMQQPHTGNNLTTKGHEVQGPALKRITFKDNIGESVQTHLATDVEWYLCGQPRREKSLETEIYQSLPEARRWDREMSDKGFGF